jgi:hypothetical protein
MRRWAQAARQDEKNGSQSLNSRDAKGRVGQTGKRTGEKEAVRCSKLV